MSELLNHKFSTAKAKYRLVSLSAGTAIAIAWFLAAVMFTALADRWWNLPRLLRIMVLLINLALALFYFLRHGITPLLRGMDDESLALAVERMEPVFMSRLIAAVQFRQVQPPTFGSPALVNAMIVQTEEIATSVDFRRAVETHSLRRWLVAVGALIVVTVLLYLLYYPLSGILAARVFGQAVAWPSRTHVSVNSGSFLIGIGDSATLQANGTGVLPDSGLAEIQFASGRHESIIISRIAGADYAGTLSDVPEPFTYRITLGDDTSASYSVRALPRPVAVTISCTQIYPAYTHLPDAKRETSSLSLLSGSRLRVVVTTNEPLRATGQSYADGLFSCVRFSQKSGTDTIAPVKLKSIGADTHAWTAEFPLPDYATGMSVFLIDDAGLESKNGPSFPLSFITDRAPTIRIASPKLHETLVTNDSLCTLEYLAEDDYAVESVVLKYRINEGQEQAAPIKIPTGQSRVKAEYGWSIATLRSTGEQANLEGSVIEFYLEAQDGNTLSGPGKAASDHYQLRVITKAEKQAELLARMGESFSAVKDLSDKQQKVATDLSALMNEKKAATQPVKQNE